MVPAGLASVYRDQIVRFGTHLNGSPTETVAWTPLPAGDPLELHLIAAGDVGDSGDRLDAGAS